MLPLATFVARSAYDTLKRFPAPLLSAAVAAGLLIDAQHHDFRGQDPLIFVLAASLGIPLGLALTLVAEHPPSWLSRIAKPKLAAFLATLLLVTAYGLALHGARDQGEGYLLRYAQLSLAAHLAVSFAPYLSRSASMLDAEAKTRGVWQLNRSFFLRLPLSAVYAGVVFGGLALALAAVAQLFDLQVQDDRYFELWVLCAFVLQTWHFLAGVPTDFEQLKRQQEYPRGLRIFAQFVLLPLLGLYLVILYAYGTKIALAASLPVGWVGWMVSAAGGFGMLALLLLFPAREGTSGRFVRAVEVTFHVAILPLLGLLFVSLGQRMEAYAVTERRYFLFVLGVWLAGASIYRLRWGRRTIAWIPITLLLVSALTSVGPWGALSVSRESQSARLTKLLRKSDAVHGPSSRKAVVSFEDEREMSRILDYLIETHGKKTLRRWPSLQGSAETAADFLSQRDLHYVERYASHEPSVSFHARTDHPLEVKGYDWLIAVQAHDQAGPLPQDTPFSVRLLPSESVLEVTERDGSRGRISLEPLVDRLQAQPPTSKGELPPLVVDGHANGLRLRLVLAELYAEKQGERWKVTNVGGQLLIAR